MVEENKDECEMCKNREDFFRKQILSLLFNKDKNKVKDNFKSDINNLQKIGGTSKGYCGKILRGSDVGFKCLDCEMDSTW